LYNIVKIKKKKHVNVFENIGVFNLH